MGSTTAIAMVGTSILTATGDISQGNQAKKMADYNAGIDLNKASAIRQAAEFNDQKAAAAQVQLQGEQQAAYAGANIDINSGTPLDVAVQSISASNLDRAIGKYNAEVNARGFESSAAIEKMQGKDAQNAGRTKAIGTLLEAAGNYAKGQKFGETGGDAT